MADDSGDACGDDKDYGFREGVHGAVKMVKRCVLNTLLSTDEDVEKPVDWDNSDEYNFQHGRRGVALIVCNEMFDGNSNRKGADLDAFHFENTFRKLGFSDIRIKYDMTAQDMVDWFTAVSKEDHSDADCLAVAITSHGEQEVSVDKYRYNVNECKDTILGSQGSVCTQDLVEKFSDVNCPTLAGKPKIFLLQACRGTKLDPGVEVEPYKDEDVVDALSEPEYTISPAPCYKDFCIVYATPPGHFAFRRPSEGSWFVKSLWDVVKRVDPSKISFQKLLTNVICSVANEYQSSSSDVRINAKKQSGCIYSMLTKDIYFTAKSNPEEELMV